MHAVALSPVEPLSPEWHAQRSQGLGGSDAAAAVGLDPYRSPMALYLERIGEVAGTPENDAMRWGRRLEAAIADEFAEQTGLGVYSPEAMLRHPEHGWMLASPDRLLFEPETGPGRTVGLLEVKTAGAHLADVWDDGPPVRHQLQVQHYFAVTGLDRAHLAVLIGGRDYRTFELARDDETIDHLIALEAEFWARVVERRPPPVDGSPATSDALARLYERVEPDSQIVLPGYARDLLRDRAAAKQTVDAALEDLRRVENQLKDLLGPNTVGLLDGEPAVTWKPVTSRRLDTKALRAAHPEIAAEFETETTSRRFLVSKKGAVA